MTRHGCMDTRLLPNFEDKTKQKNTEKFHRVPTVLSQFPSEWGALNVQNVQAINYSTLRYVSASPHARFNRFKVQVLTPEVPACFLRKKARSLQRESSRAKRRKFTLGAWSPYLYIRHRPHRGLTVGQEPL